MNKDEFFDVIIKGFGVAFLFLAIMIIPKVFESISSLIAMVLYSPEGAPTGDFKYIFFATKPAVIAQGVGAVIKFIIYIIASINFLRSGSWVKKLMGLQNAPQGE